MRQFLKFALVGVLNTLVDLLVLTLLIYLEPSGRAGLLYAFFKAVAFIVANLNSYIFNKMWTFKGQGGDKKTGIEFFKYFVVSVVGISINVGIATLVATYIQPPLASLDKFWPQISALFGTAAGLLWNFAGYKIFVFTKKY